MSNDDLVDSLIKMGCIKSRKVISAFKKVDRKNFVPEKFRNLAYSDSPLPIGPGATISQPLTVAFMTEALDVEKNSKVLEIGTGSGYQAAVLSKLCSKVITVEISPNLVKFAGKNLKNYKKVKVIEGEGLEGFEKESPYDRIISTAHVSEIPSAWFDQLKENGKIVAPVGNKDYQRLILFEKKKGKIVETDLGFPCVFVPMK